MKVDWSMTTHYESYICEPKVIESMHRAMIAEWQKNNIPVMKKIWIFVYILIKIKMFEQTHASCKIFHYSAIPIFHYGSLRRMGGYWIFIVTSSIDRNIVAIWLYHSYEI